MTPFLSKTGGDLIGLAMGKIKAQAQGQTLNAFESGRALDLLNIVVSDLRNEGLMLWKRETNFLFPVANQSDYPISDTAGSEWTQTYNLSTLSTAAILGATTLTVSSIANITSGDRIGIYQDNGTRFWTTVNGVPSGTTVPLMAGLTNTAAIGNSVFNYTTKAYRPQKITKFFRRNGLSQPTDVPLMLYAYDDYQGIPTKQTSGTINVGAYDPQKDTGHIFLWAPPSNSGDIIGCVCQMPFLQFSVSSDKPDFLQEHLGALTDMLALRLHPFYKSNLQERQMLQMDAATSLNAALNYQQETASLRIVPGRWRR